MTAGGYDPASILAALKQRGGSGEKVKVNNHDAVNKTKSSNESSSCFRIAEENGAFEASYLARHCRQLQDLLQRRVGTPRDENTYVSELEATVVHLQKENARLLRALRGAAVEAEQPKMIRNGNAGSPTTHRSGLTRSNRAAASSLPSPRSRTQNINDGSLSWIHPDKDKHTDAPPFIAMSRRGSLFRNNLLDGSAFHVHNTAYRNDTSLRATMLGNRTYHPQVVHIPARVRALRSGSDPSTKPRVVVDLH